MPPAVVMPTAAAFDHKSSPTGDVAHEHSTVGRAVPVRVHHRQHTGLIVALGWVVAVGFIALTAANYQVVATAADSLELAWRQSPQNVAGRGACAELAKAQPPTMFDPDSHVWINLTQRQIHDGTVRPHDFPYDNAPVGRGRHWSSSFSWWLIALGAVTHFVSGVPWDAAIAQSAAWANPVLFVLFLTGLAVVMRKRLDAWTVGAFLVTLAALWGVEWDFSYGRPDHHGLHLMAFLGLVLGAMIGGLGWTRVGPALPQESHLFLVRLSTWKQARGWMTLSGVCGGLGLWVGSTQQVVCVAVLGTGATLGVLLFGGKKWRVEGVRFAPELWLRWSRAGALTSLAFYGIEYFPAHMEMRLEVNHPLLALGWLGAGELMTILMLARTDWANIQRRGGETVMRAVMGLLAVSLFPLAIVCGPKAWFTLGDPVMLRAAAVISEGRPWIDPPSVGKALHEFWNYTGALIFVLPLAAWVLIAQRRRLPAWRQAGVVTGLTLVGVFLGWTLVQNRWMGFMETSLAVLTLAVAPCVGGRQNAEGRRQKAEGRMQKVEGRRQKAEGGGWRVEGREWKAGVPLVLLALTVPGWIGYGVLQGRTLMEDPVVHAKATLGDMMAYKEVAWNLKLAADKRADTTRPARVMTSPGPSPVLHYYGGVDAVGSYYWENLVGAHVSMDFFNDESGDVARRIAKERGIDFVEVTVTPAFVLELQWLALGRTDVAAARRTLAFRLANPLVKGNLPEWLEAVPLKDAPMAQAQGARIYRVVRERL